jgi:hypothetical protein
MFISTIFKNQAGTEFFQSMMSSAASGKEREMREQGEINRANQEAMEREAERERYAEEEARQREIDRQNRKEQLRREREARLTQERITQDLFNEALQNNQSIQELAISKGYGGVPEMCAGENIPNIPFNIQVFHVQEIASNQGIKLDFHAASHIANGKNRNVDITMLVDIVTKGDLYYDNLHQNYGHYKDRYFIPINATTSELKTVYEVNPTFPASRYIKQ